MWTSVWVKPSSGWTTVWVTGWTSVWVTPKKMKKKRENRIDSSALFSFERMCWISVQTVDNPVPETFKIGVSICQSEDFFDQWISSFDWSIGDSSILIDWKRIYDFSLPIKERRSQCLKFWNAWNSKSIDDLKQLIFCFFQVQKFCLIESMIHVIKDVGIIKFFVQWDHHGK